MTNKDRAKKIDQLIGFKNRKQKLFSRQPCSPGLPQISVRRLKFDLLLILTISPANF